MLGGKRERETKKSTNHGYMKYIDALYSILLVVLRCDVDRGGYHFFRWEIVNGFRYQDSQRRLHCKCQTFGYYCAGSFHETICTYVFLGLMTSEGISQTLI